MKLQAKAGSCILMTPWRPPRRAVHEYPHAEILASSPKASLNDYDRWVLSRLAEERGESCGTVAGWIIDRWIGDNRQALAADYGIDRAAYHAARPHPHPDVGSVEKDGD
jgi:hypothetical protein